MTTEDLIIRLRAQFDEDERVALAATPGPWKSHDDGLVWPPRIGDPVSGSTEIEDATHIAHWDPERVIADVKAKRALVNLAEQMLRPVPVPLGYPAEALTIKTAVEDGEARAAVVLLKILAVGAGIPVAPETTCEAAS